ncbi:MAG: hypothetical protein LBO81_00875, partial [Clostridiales Family XIII bacterium]|nr:hypothetical protein [Clostridiales Family XIII bacterium]
MKQFIVLAAVIPVMLAFVMQFTLEQANFSRSMRAEEVVHSARIEAEWNGGFTEEAKKTLARNIADIYGVTAEDVAIEADVIGESFGRIGFYRIIVPVPKIVAANRLFGISDEANCGRYVVEGSFPSLPGYLATFKPDEEFLFPDPDAPALPDPNPDAPA